MPDADDEVSVEQSREPKIYRSARAPGAGLPAGVTRL